MIWGWSRLVQQKVKVFASWLFFSQWISLASRKGEEKKDTRVFTATCDVVVSLVSFRVPLQAIPLLNQTGKGYPEDRTTVTTKTSMSFIRRISLLGITTMHNLSGRA